MTLEIVISVISVAVGLVALVYAMMTNREKARLEKLIAAELRGLAASIDWVRTNSAWASSHFGSIQEQALSLDRSDQVNGILVHTQKGDHDTVAAERMMTNLFNQVLTLQEGIFGTRIVTYPKEFKRLTKYGGQQEDATDG